MRLLYKSNEDNDNDYDENETNICQRKNDEHLSNMQEGLKREQSDKKMITTK